MRLVSAFTGHVPATWSKRRATDKVSGLLHGRSLRVVAPCVNHRGSGWPRVCGGAARHQAPHRPRLQLHGERDHKGGPEPVVQYLVPGPAYDLPLLPGVQLWADRRDAQRFCRNVDDPRGKEAHWVTAPQLQVQLVTSRHDWNYERKAFEIVLTSYRQSLHFDGCYKGEYQCGNKFCIWRELTCNNENNCGDLSDENCMSKTLAVAVTIAAGITVVVLIFALVAYIRKRAQIGPHPPNHAARGRSTVNDRETESDTSTSSRPLSKSLAVQPSPREDLSRTTSSQSVHSAGSGISGAYDTTYRPLVGKHLFMEPLLEVPSVQASALPSRTSSEDNVPQEAQGGEKRLRPCIRYDRSVSDPM